MMEEQYDLRTYNVKVVVQETGIKPETLRAWERRYGLPEPQRSGGGHRLYSRKDIDMVKWLISRQEGGLSISNAVELWKSFADQGLDPLQSQKDDSYSAFSQAVSVESLAELRNAWVKACREFNETKADQVLTTAFALYPAEAVCINLIGGGLAQIGDGWYAGNVTVQQEHFASELAMRRLETLIASAPPPTRSSRILVAAPPEEKHSFILLLMTLMLRRRGLHVIHLGIDVPLSYLQNLLMQIRPKLVVSSAQQLHTAASMLDLALLLDRERTPLAFGGRIFNINPSLRSRIPGYFLGEKMDQAPQVLEQLISEAPPPPAFQPIPEHYYSALEHYNENLPEIEAHIWQEIHKSMLHDHVATANMNVARDIRAALRLGDMSYMGSEVEWIEGLLVNNNIPETTLYAYLNIYHKALTDHLNSRGDPIIRWFNQITQARISESASIYHLGN